MYTLASWSAVMRGVRREASAVQRKPGGGVTTAAKRLRQLEMLRNEVLG